MICSLNELGVETSSDGIAVLDDFLDNGFSKGDTLAPLIGLDDVIFDLAITANRPDGMSILGIAREVSALTDTSLTFLIVLPYAVNKILSFGLSLDATGIISPFIEKPSINPFELDFNVKLASLHRPPEIESILNKSDGTISICTPAIGSLFNAKTFIFI